MGGCWIEGAGAEAASGASDGVRSGLPSGAGHILVQWAMIVRCRRRFSRFFFFFFRFEPRVYFTAEFDTLIKDN